jgi:hypothetical protein
MTDLLEPIYPALARATFEALAETLTLAYRNDNKNPTLSAELRRAAATAASAHGVVGDKHVSAIADLAADTMMLVLPQKHVEINEIPNVERTKDAFTRARRDYIIDLFGGSPMRILAPWMKQLADHPSLRDR